VFVHGQEIGLAVCQQLMTDRCGRITNFEFHTLWTGDIRFSGGKNL